MRPYVLVLTKRIDMEGEGGKKQGLLAERATEICYLCRCVCCVEKRILRSFQKRQVTHTHKKTQRCDNEDLYRFTAVYRK